VIVSSHGSPSGSVAIAQQLQVQHLSFGTGRLETVQLWKLAINRLIASENIDSFGSFPPPVPGALNRKRRMAPLEGRIHFSFVADLIIFSQGLPARICDFPGVGKSQGTFAGIQRDDHAAGEISSKRNGIHGILGTLRSPPPSENGSRQHRHARPNSYRLRANPIHSTQWSPFGARSNTLRP
jgi:hypothetical protein